MATQQGTVIIGTGIVGVSTAYFLSLSPRTPAQSIHLVEASPELFASASGFSGGFLAKDWFSPAVAELGALSFNLHKQLAEEHDGRARWGYSPSTGTSMMEAGGSGHRGDEWLREGGSRAESAAVHEYSGEDDQPPWLTRKPGQQVDVISEAGTTAQVDPFRLCQFLLGESLDRGVRLHHPAKVLSVSQDMKGTIASVRIASGEGDEVDVPCTRLVITAGAWSPEVFSTLFPSSKTRIPVGPLAGHSIVLRSPRWTKEHEPKGCHAIFTTDPAGFSPELFSRIGGEIYLAGVNSSSIPLPRLPTDAKPHRESINQLKATARRLLALPESENDLEIIREGLCFRPVTARGPPLVTRLPDKALGDGISTRGGGDGGVFLSAGHGPWGIAQSLGTGKVLSELIEEQPVSASIKGLSLL